METIHEVISKDVLDLNTLMNSLTQQELEQLKTNYDFFIPLVQKALICD